VKYLAYVDVKLRPGISDPEGATIARALPALGFDSVHAVHVGKRFTVELEASDAHAAQALAASLADRLLANTVIEESVIHVTEA